MRLRRLLISMFLPQAVFLFSGMLPNFRHNWNTFGNNPTKKGRIVAKTVTQKTHRFKKIRVRFNILWCAPFSAQRDFPAQISFVAKTIDSQPISKRIPAARNASFALPSGRNERLADSRVCLSRAGSRHRPCRGFFGRPKWPTQRKSGGVSPAQFHVSGSVFTARFVACGLNA